MSNNVLGTVNDFFGKFDDVIVGVVQHGRRRIDAVPTTPSVPAVPGRRRLVIGTVYLPEGQEINTPSVVSATESMEPEEVPVPQIADAVASTSPSACTSPARSLTEDGSEEVPDNESHDASDVALTPPPARMRHETESADAVASTPPPACSSPARSLTNDGSEEVPDNESHDVNDVASTPPSARTPSPMAASPENGRDVQQIDIIDLTQDTEDESQSIGESTPSRSPSPAPTINDIIDLTQDGDTEDDYQSIEESTPPRSPSPAPVVRKARRRRQSATPDHHVARGRVVLQTRRVNKRSRLDVSLVLRRRLRPRQQISYVEADSSFEEEERYEYKRSRNVGSSDMVDDPDNCEVLLNAELRKKFRRFCRRKNVSVEEMILEEGVIENDGVWTKINREFKDEFDDYINEFQ